MINAFGVEYIDISKLDVKGLAKLQPIRYSRNPASKARAEKLYQNHLRKTKSPLATKAGLPFNDERKMQAIRSSEKIVRANERFNAGYTVSAPKAENIAAAEFDSGFKANMANWKHVKGKNGPSHSKLSDVLTKERKWLRSQ